MSYAGPDVSSSSSSRHSAARGHAGRVGEAKSRPRLKWTRVGASLHECVECGYTSARKGDLRRHVLTHTGVKSYACDECEYITAQTESSSHTLTKHTQAHV